MTTPRSSASAAVLPIAARMSWTFVALLNRQPLRSTGASSSVTCTPLNKQPRQRSRPLRRNDRGFARSDEQEHGPTEFVVGIRMAAEALLARHRLHSAVDHQSAVDEAVDQRGQRAVDLAHSGDKPVLVTRAFF